MIAAFRKVKEGDTYVLENNKGITIENKSTIGETFLVANNGGVVYDIKRNGNPTSKSLSKLGFDIRKKISKYEYPELFL